MPIFLPSPIERDHLRRIHDQLGEFSEHGRESALAVACKLMLQDRGFAVAVPGNPNLPEKFEEPSQLLSLAWAYLYHLLGRRDRFSAAMLLWDKETFTPEPRCVRLIWEAMADHRMIILIGGGAMSKTYGPSVFFLLEYLVDPEWTRFQVASASEDHLRKNLYADIVRLHEGSVLPLPGVPDTESISLNKKDAMGIFTMVLPGGPQSKGKIKGAHTKPRPEHPMFGRRSRVFTLIDEGQEVPQNIFAEIPNRFSTMVAGDVEHLKFVVSANPKDQYSEFGRRAAPASGFVSLRWEDEVWTSEMGWRVVSLNAMRHENVVARKVIYPGFVTYEGVQNWLQACHGDDQHPDMFTFVYGRFPPQGVMTSVIQKSHVQASEGEWIFDTPTTPVAGCDPAFTGDEATLPTGRTGRAIAWIGFDGVRHELKEPRIGLQIDVVGILPRRTTGTDTQDLADEVMDRCHQMNISPDRYGQDKGGNAIGIHDLIRRQWREKVGTGNLPVDAAAPIVGIDFGASPTEVKIAEEDTLNPREMFVEAVDELWYATAKLFECDCVRLGRGVDPKSIQQLVARRGGSRPGRGKKRSIESKKEYKSRTGESSPDRADGIVILCQVARLTTPGLVPKARDTKAELPAKWPPFEGTDLKESAFHLVGAPAIQVIETMRD